MKKWGLATFFLLCFNTVFSQEVILNELVAKNALSYVNNDGKTPDWIELRNLTSSPIDLSSYSLATSKTFNSPVPLPKENIRANGYYLMELTKAVSSVRQWSSVVEYGDEFSYCVPTDEQTGWYLPSYDDSQWKRGKTPIGYGETDVVTSVPEARSVFMRATFQVTHVERMVRLVLHMDYDDGFIAYINGTEVARSNMDASNFDSFSTSYMEGVMKQGDVPSSYDITNFMSCLHEGENVLCIQIHNCSTTSSDLLATPILSVGYDTQYTDVAGCSPYLDLQCGSSISLSASADTLYLLKDSRIVDHLSWENLPVDVSLGRVQGDNVSSFYFSDPTPNAANGSDCYIAKTLDKPKFDVPAGVYPKSFVLNVFTGEKKSILRYTTDGSVPTESSPMVTEAFKINKNSNIRVRAFRNGYLPSETATASYVISMLQDLPIASLTVSYDDFWGYQTGIYVEGPFAEEEEPHFGANYWQDWEKPVHLDFFETNGACVVSQDLGCKIGGNWSRAENQKTLKLYARDEYGKDKIEYGFFPDKPISDFHMILLRNSGNDFNNTQMRDGVISVLAKDMDIDRQAYRPAVVYLNGMYYGIQNIREKQNKHYIAENYGLDKEDIDVIKNGNEVADGNSTDYWKMRNFIENTDLTVSENYEIAKTFLDISSYIDYYVLEMYVVNEDWPGNNIACWHSRSQNTPWRYLLFDCDFGLGIWELDRKVKVNMLEWCTAANSDNYANAPWSTAMLRSLLKNKDFRRDFLNATADRLNTTLSANNVCAVIDSIYGLIEDEMEFHIQRWGDNWQEGWFNDMRQFAQRREFIVREQTEDFFSINGNYVLSLSLSEPGAGKIRLNTIEVVDFPWKGYYFNNNEIFLTAVPNPGYEFVGWEGAVSSSQSSISFTTDTSVQLQAVFKYVGNEPNIVISEVCYHTNNAEETEWVELYNEGDVVVDMSGFELHIDRYNQSFVFPQSLSLNPGQYIVCVNDSLRMPSRFHEKNIIGNLSFKFPKDAALLTLKNGNGCLLDSMSYSDHGGHIKKADGYGYSCEKIDGNWYSSQYGGTPGSLNSPNPVLPTYECDIVITEINYASSSYADVGDWVELYNPPNAAIVHLKDWMFQDAKGRISVVTEDVVVAPGEYVVFASEPSKFMEAYPSVMCYSLSLSLNKCVDKIILFDSYEFVVDEVAYSMFDDAWTKSAFETGRTLSLRSYEQDNSLGFQWGASASYGGTPGKDNECLAFAQFVATTSSVEVYVVGKRVCVDGADGEEIRVYDSAGHLVAQSKSTEQTIEIPIARMGIYLVSCGKNAFTVIVK